MMKFLAPFATGCSYALSGILDTGSG